MSKPQEYSDKLRGDFRRYLLKIACNKSDPSLTETEILKAFDLAVQKQKLTSLEAELVLPKQGIISKIDVSGEMSNKELATICETLYAIADLHCDYEVNESILLVDSAEFDEPCSAMKARNCLLFIANGRKG